VVLLQFKHDHPGMLNIVVSLGMYPIIMWLERCRFGFKKIHA